MPLWTLENIYDFVKTFGYFSGLTSVQHKQLCDLRMAEVYAHAHLFAQVSYTFDLVSGTKYYYLRSDLNVLSEPRFYNQDTGDELTTKRSESQVLSEDPQENESGRPYYMAYAGLSEVQAQPASASAVTIKSSEAADTSKKVVIRGLVGGYEDVEVITTNATDGTTEATGAKSFTEIWTCRKEDECAGFVTVKAGTAMLAVIEESKARAEYPKFRAWPTPSVTDTIKVIGTRIYRPMTQDSDVPDVPLFCIPGFIQGIMAEAFAANGHLARQKVAEERFREMIAKLEAIEGQVGESYLGGKRPAVTAEDDLSLPVPAEPGL